MSDEVAHKNILALKGFVDDTRKLIREQGEMITHLVKLIKMQENRIEDLQTQITGIRVQVMKGGPTSGSSD